MPTSQLCFISFATVGHSHLLGSPHTTTHSLERALGCSAIQLSRTFLLHLSIVKKIPGLVPLLTACMLGLQPFMYGDYIAYDCWLGKVYDLKNQIILKLSNGAR